MSSLNNKPNNPKVDYRFIRGMLELNILGVRCGDSATQSQIIGVMEGYGARGADISHIFSDLEPSSAMGDSDQKFLFYSTNMVSKSLETWVEQMIGNGRPKVEVNQSRYGYRGQHNGNYQ